MSDKSSILVHNGTRSYDQLEIKDSQILWQTVIPQAINDKVLIRFTRNDKHFFKLVNLGTF